MSDLSPKFGPVTDLLSQLFDEYENGLSPIAGEAIRLFPLRVIEKAGMRGIARQLVITATKRGQSKGFCNAITEATNPISQHVFQELGFVTKSRHSYRDDRYQGGSYFTSIEDQGRPMLTERLLAGKRPPRGTRTQPTIER